MNKNAGSKPKTIRNDNLKLILDLYRKNNSLSVSDISGMINLSRTTVSKINEKLLLPGLIVSCGKGGSTEEGGKKPELFSLNRKFGHIAIFHILDGFINLKIFDLSLEVLRKEKIRTDVNEKLENIMIIIAREVKLYLNPGRSADLPPLIGIAVAVHGIVDSEKGLCYIAPHFPSWGNNRNIRDMVIEKIGKEIPVHVESWIRFKAYSAKENYNSGIYRNYVLLDAGLHGIVSGLVINGKLHSGSHYLSGEIGHTIVSASETRQCYCGGRGCLETFIDCRNLVNRAVSLKNEYPDSLVFRGKSLPDVFEIFKASNSGDALACMLMNEIARWFAIGLSNIFLMFDPEVIFFEGDYSTAGEFFEKKLRENINKISLNRLEKDFRIVFHEPTHNATALGAAAFARDYYLHSSIEA